MASSAFIGFLLGACGTAALTPVVLRMLTTRGVMDTPGARTLHAEPTPRGLGIAPWVVGLAAVFILTLVGGAGEVPWSLLPIAGGLGAVGLFEDVRGVGPTGRLGLQIVVAFGGAVAIVAGQPTGLILGQATAAAALLLFVVAYVNAFNFMDGINGISGLQAALVGSVLTVLAARQGEVHLAVMGAVGVGLALGFLPYNFPTAKGFLGDVGSYFFGGWIAALIGLLTVTGAPVTALAGVVAIYGADTAVTLVQRVGEGESWRTPHRRHVYQRLVALGWSHAQSALFVTAATGLCAAVGMATIGAGVLGHVTAAFLIAAVVAGYLIAPALSRRPWTKADR